MSDGNKIVRATIEATNEMVANALEEDLAGRSNDLIAFVQLLDCIDGNYSIFLDAPWGSGKTFFVKEAAAILRDGNKHTRIDGGAGVGLAQLAELENLHLPIYFNAWECDYRDEPVASLIETLVDGFAELKGDEKIEADLKDAGLAIIKALGFSFGPINLNMEPAVDGAVSHDVILPLRRDREIRARLVSMLDKVVVERAERIVLFIDELDRCRPAYAVRLLEAIKFLFDHERLTVVFSVDCPMLAQAVCGCYGAGFDGEAYLSRFYDERFRLPDVDAEHQMMLGRYWVRGGLLLWETARAVIKRGDMSLRDQLKFTSLLTAYGANGAANEGQACDGVIFVRNIIGPLLLCCQFVDPSLLRRFLSGEVEGFEGFWQKFEGVEAFSRMTISLCQKARQLGYESCDSPKSAFVSCLCPEMLGVESESSPGIGVLMSSKQGVAEDFRGMLRKLHIG